MGRKQTLVYAVIILIVIIAIVIAVIKSPDNEVSAETAQCIGEKSIVYISTGCSACAKQKEVFGENFKYLNQIDCAIKPEQCANIIEAVPTWIINQEKHIGVKSIDELKKLTGC